MYRSNDYFGETGILQSATRSASCIAVGKVRVLYLAKLNFKAVIPDQVLQRLDAVGTICRIESTLKETDAIHASSFVSDFSRHQCFSSTIAEARNQKQNSKLQRTSRQSEFDRMGGLGGGAGGVGRLVTTIRTFQNKTKNYAFVQLATETLSNKITSPFQKEKMTIDLLSFLGTAPKRTSSKLYKMHYALKARHLIHTILQLLPKKRTRFQCMLLVECIRNCHCFTSLTNHLTQSELEHLAREFTLMTYQPMERIFVQGPASDDTS
jgi:hypothetical protein